MLDTTDDFFGFAHKGKTEEDPEEQDNSTSDEQQQEENPSEQAEEEEQEKQQTDVDASSEDSEEEEENGEFSFAPIINELAEAGILVYDEEKEYDNSEEGFQEVIQDTVAAKFKEQLEAIPEDFRSIMDHLKAGGTLQEWVDRMDPTDYANADLEDEQTQETLVREQFKAQGFSDTQIERKVTKLKDQGLLDSEAEDAQEFLVEKQKKDRVAYEKQLEAHQETVAKQQKEFLDTRKTEIFAQEEFAGIKPSKEKKQELFNFLYTPGKDGKTAFQKLLADPKKLAEIAFKELAGVGTETYQRKAETKATGKLLKAMQKYAPQKNTNGKTVRTNIETKGIPVKGMPWE